jgi:predicted O-methyltransferase YrrM
MDYSEMLIAERAFLDRLLREKKPKKILEVGVAAGASTVVILNAMRDLPGSKLFSVEVSKDYYQDVFDSARKEKRLSGFLVKEYFPGIDENQWQLFTGNVAAAFLEQIGGDVDFVLLDASHNLPGELLDLIMVLPFLKTGATVVVHDVNLNYNNANLQFFLTACRVLFSVVTADNKKLIETCAADKLPNIGSFEISQGTRDNISDVFQILTVPWWYVPEEKHRDAMLTLFKKHYDEKNCDLFATAYDFQRRYIGRSAILRSTEEQIYASRSRLRKLAIRFRKYVPFKRFIKKCLPKWD